MLSNLVGPGSTPKHWRDYHAQSIENRPLEQRLIALTWFLHNTNKQMVWLLPHSPALCITIFRAGCKQKNSKELISKKTAKWNFLVSTVTPHPGVEEEEQPSTTRGWLPFRSASSYRINYYQQIQVMGFFFFFGTLTLKMVNWKPVIFNIVFPPHTAMVLVD